MNIIILGPPGSGKGTISLCLERSYGFRHITTGELFRKAIANETPLGNRLKLVLDKGELVDDDLTTSLVQERVFSLPSSHYIFDGYPRNLAQAHALDTFCTIDKVLSLELLDSVVIERVINRLICSQCGRVYNRHSLPPQKAGSCDTCSAQLIQRDDDVRSTIERRLAIYHQQTQPLKELYQKRHLLVPISAERSPSEILKEITTLLHLPPNTT